MSETAAAGTAHSIDVAGKRALARAGRRLREGLRARLGPRNNESVLVDHLGLDHALVPVRASRTRALQSLHMYTMIQTLQFKGLAIRKRREDCSPAAISKEAHDLIASPKGHGVP